MLGTYRVAIQLANDVRPIEVYRAELLEPIIGPTEYEIAIAK
jgi:hypothetical protein